MKQKFLTAVFGTVLILGSSLSFAELAGEYRFVGYMIGFDGDHGLGFGDQKIVLADMGDITLSTSNLFSGEIAGRELIRQISNVESNIAGEKLYYSGFSVAAGDVVEPLSGSAILEEQLVMQIFDEDGSFPFYFNTTTNVALAFPGVEAEQGSSDLGLGLLIRKGTGLDNVAVQGTYAGYSFGHAFDSDGLASGTGNVDRLTLSTIAVTFNGSGSFTGSADEWEASRTLSDQQINEGDDRHMDTMAFYETYENTVPLAGTYSVAGDGSMLLVEGEDSMPLQVSADANLAASALGGDVEAVLLLFVKQPDNMPTAVSNVFFFTEMDEHVGQWDPSEFFDELECSRNYLFLKPDNTFAMRSDFWGVGNHLLNLHETIEEPSRRVSRNAFNTHIDEKTVEFENGTYSIAPNGVVTLNFPNGETGMGQVSANGEYLVAAYAGSENALDYERGLIFGIHREPPAVEQPVLLAIETDASGAAIQVSSAPDSTFEALYSGNLTEGEWRSSGIYTNTSGSVVISDASATNETQRFYRTTFRPW